MTYRMFDTATWDDPWFDRLDSECKLLFIYLWTNKHCNQAGMYRINRRVMEAHCGINSDCLSKLRPKVEYFPDESIVWIKNFFKWQCQNPSFVAGAIRECNKLPVAFFQIFLQHNLKRIKKQLKGSKYGSLLKDITQCLQDADTLLTVKESKEQYPKESKSFQCSCGNPKREAWHDLCDTCFKNKPARPHPKDHKVSPCTECGWPAYPGYTGMIDGKCEGCRSEQQQKGGNQNAVL